jgi:hypothetical protein
VYQALFLCEGSSDQPLADHIEALFRTLGLELRVVQPDFALLADKVTKDLPSRLATGARLMGYEPDLVICHRDTDNTSIADRRAEMTAALHVVGSESPLVAVIPVRMTEAWLMLDERAIRTVAGNPRGKVDLQLPKVANIERMADPKAYLQKVILVASETSGRRRERLDRRFSSNRRQLLERLDLEGPITQLPSWQALLQEVATAASVLGAAK